MRSFSSQKGSIPLGAEPLQANDSGAQRLASQSLAKLQAASRALSHGSRAATQLGPDVSKACLLRATQDASAILANKQSLANVADWKALPHSCACIAASVSASTHVKQCEAEMEKEGSLQALANVWQTRHLCLPVQEKRANIRATRTHPCCLAGICHCRGGPWPQGGLASRKLNAWLRQAFPGKPGSATLCRGMVCQIICSKRNWHQSGQTSEEEAPFHPVRVLLVALQYLRPFRSTYIELEAAFERDKTVLENWTQEGVVAPPSTYVSLRVREAVGGRPTVITSLTFLRTLDLSKPWLVGSAELSSRERPFPNSSGLVKVKLDGMQMSEFWKGEEMEPELIKLLKARAHPRQRRPSAPGSTLDDSGMVDIDVGFAEDEFDNVEGAAGHEDGQEASDYEAGAEPEGEPANELDLASLEVDFPESMLAYIEEAAAQQDRQDRLACSSSTSSTSSSTSLDEEPQSTTSVRGGDVGHSADIPAQKRARRPQSFEWHHFSFTYRAGPPSGWQILCRYHQNSTSKCTKSGCFHDPASSEEVIKRMKSWALGAQRHTSKEAHCGQRGLPPVAPEHCNLTDSDLDALASAMPAP